MKQIKACACAKAKCLTAQISLLAIDLKHDEHFPEIKEEKRVWLSRRRK